ncbi:MAG: branched-chain amino acid transaminase [Anaerolineae bacterium]|nr:branched-chain amino acid transaminase [Anaerolineae bacterium]
MPIPEAKYIWFDGELVPWAEAKVHVLTHALHYGSAVFEGMRAYPLPEGPAGFRLDEHLQRLLDSAKIYRMPIRYSLEELRQAVKDTVRANGHRGCYIRPLAMREYREMGVDPRGCAMQVAIATWEWGAYLGADAIEKGIHVCVSSWHRAAPNTFPTLAKSAANYANSQLIKMEALENGYAEAIVLDTNGYVSEGSGENLFLVKKGRIYTPPLSNSVLGGITRDCVMVLARDLGYDLQESVLTREMLYLADELFFSGTAAEITPIRSVDKISVGSGERGPITEALQSAFFEIVQGRVPDRHGWLTPLWE